MTHTSMSEARWHQIPSPNARINRIENVILNLTFRITEANAEIGNLRNRLEQLETENQQLKEYVYNG